MLPNRLSPAAQAPGKSGAKAKADSKAYILCGAAGIAIQI